MHRLASLLIPLLLGLAVTSCDQSVPPGGERVAAVKEIKVAYDPNKAALFEDLVNTYNKRAPVKVTALNLELPQMLEAIAAGDLVGASPDSSIWLEIFDRAWQSASQSNTSIVGTTARYASTPVVIATWRGREGELGAAGERGWGALLRRASQDASYRWSHGSPRASASGMLALIAEFYAGANKTFGLTKADADREEVRRSVAEIEKTIARYGGESDAALVDYLLKEGQQALAAIVMPEASVFDFNKRSRTAKLYGIQPVEGTLMLDHPLVLLETASLRPEQRRAFLDFARFLVADGQAIVNKHGYRPVDVGFEGAASPLESEGLSTSQPRLLQMPAPGILAYLQSAWASGLKRRANIVLLVDVSGSMEGEKLKRTKEALTSFLNQIPSNEERVALATFSTDYREVVSLGRLGDNRQRLSAAVDQLAASGSTSLFYALWRAHRTLEQLQDKERINVVVAMTDGQENNSGSYSRRNVAGVGMVPSITGNSAKDVGPLVRALQSDGSNTLIFNVGYGGEPDMQGLSTVSGAFGGRAYQADPGTIRKLYELISQYF